MSVEIRSYRRVFDLERRIYRIDRLRLNPGGIPLRGVLYCLASLICLLCVRDLPLLGAIETLLPWYLVDLALPLGLATLLTAIRIEGRPFHLAALAVLRFAGGSRRLTKMAPAPAFGSRWRPDELLMLPDGSDSRLRRMRYTGPGAALISSEHGEMRERSSWVRELLGRPELTLSAPSRACRPARARVIELARGVRLVVR